MKYTLDNILKIVRHLETNIAPDNNCHFAIGGSCVMQGQSDKDFDVFAYPRKGSWVNPEDITNDIVNKLGWKLDALHINSQLTNQPLAHNQMNGYPDKQIAILTTSKGYRVDLFFMSNVSEINKNHGNSDQDDDDLPF